MLPRPAGKRDSSAPGKGDPSPLASYNRLLGGLFLVNAADRYRCNPRDPYLYGLESLRKARCFAIGLWLLETEYGRLGSEVLAAANEALR